MEGVTHILVTHGYSDHIGDTLEIAQATGAKVVTNFELSMWLASNGLQTFDPMNTGGTNGAGGFTVTLITFSAFSFILVHADRKQIENFVPP